MPSSPGVRAARGWLLAVSSAVLTLTAHAAADGEMPDPSLAVAIAGLLGWVSTALADRPRRRRQGHPRGVGRRQGGLHGTPLGIVAALAAGQLVIHTALTLFDTHHDSPGGQLVAPVTMLAAHAVATVLLAALIGGAERGLHAVVAGLHRLLPVVAIAAPVPAGQPPRVLVPAVASTHTEVLLRRVNARRGPPTYS